MNDLIGFLICYTLIVNSVGFILMGYDKSKAKKNEWRVPERKLYFVALIGGSIGIYLGMSKFRHKTKHFTFSYGIPLIIICNIIIYYLILTRFIL
ncbi:MAG: DUF1294 domain-containing protein [Vulcanibacillus sp.]